MQALTVTPRRPGTVPVSELAEPIRADSELLVDGTAIGVVRQRQGDRSGTTREPDMPTHPMKWRHTVFTKLADTIANAGARLLRSRRLVRAPIWIYKARAGALLGSRILMLEHIGRKSGAPRYVVLEAFDHPTPDTVIVPSGFGEKAQWLRNVKANPRVRVYIRSHAPVPATARVLEQQEADRALAAYIRRHPRAWDRFKPVIEATLGSRISETNTALPLVELRLEPATRK